MRKLSTVALAAFLSAAILHADTYDLSWRYSTIAIPRLDKPPTIDGTIDAAEWANASLFPPLVSMDPIRRPGLPPQERTWVWMAYTDDSLYVAWRQDLPPEELPVTAKATARDTGEGSDNTVNLWLGLNEASPEVVNISGNALSNLYDRRLDKGGIHWNPNLTYKSRPLPTGFEGELQIPFKELDLPGAPADGTKWASYLYSGWRKAGDQLFAWPYVGWRMKGQTGYVVFAGKAPAVRFEENGAVKTAGGDVKIETKLLHRPQKSKLSYNQQLYTAMQVSDVEGGTFESLDKMVGDALAPFQPATKIEAPGEYLLRYEIKAGNLALATGVQGYYKPPPLDLDATPFFLSKQQLLVEAQADNDEAKSVEVTLNPGGLKAKGEFKSRRATLRFRSDKLAEGKYEATAEAKNADGKAISKAALAIERPAPPDWWTLKEGFEPLIPPPWTPVEELRSKRIARVVGVLGRKYEFESLPLPSHIETSGASILDGMIQLETSQPLQFKEKLAVPLEMKPDAFVFQNEGTAGNLNLKVRTRIEFDGFMLIDLELTGTGTTDKLDLVIPFRKEHATLMQNYCKASGPGDPNWKNPNETVNPYKKGRRFVGEVPEYTLKTPPMMTTWIGTDHHGLEFSCDSSRGWAMAKPNEAMEVSREGDKVVLTVHFISKPVKLSSEPRRIRFGLVATPTKTLLPHMQKARFYDDYHLFLLPGQWGEYPVWHPPLKNPALIEKNKKWIATVHASGKKLMINGGWNISAQWDGWDTWGKEMIAEPLSNVSFSDCKQFAACYNTPYAQFMANSFGYNARLLGFDGICFDTVVPSYECQSLEHGCGWRDDDGNLWPTFQTFAQREIWKRLYRIFHGGVIKEGCVPVPNAAGPLMAVHSFSDMHHIGEGYYMHAATLKDGMPPDMIRANMTGDQYGFRTEVNLKGGPLFWNDKNAAILVNGSEPRFHDYRHWKVGYEAHANPAISVWNAFDWVDRWNAKWLGHWENGEYVKVDGGTNMVMASLYSNEKLKRLLLVVANYEIEPLDDLNVKLDLKKLGLKGQVFAEDAVTLEPVAISANGAMKLDVLGQRYRLIQVSLDRPQFDDSKLGPNLLADGNATMDKGWSSAPLKLEPNAIYTVSAQIKIDKDMGADSKNPNVMTMFSPQIAHYVSVRLEGDGVHGINATNALSKCNVKGTDELTPYAETDHYNRTYVPQHWEKTPGWMTVFFPVGTGAKAVDGKVSIGMTDAGQAQVKEISVRRLK